MKGEKREQLIIFSFWGFLVLVFIFMLILWSGQQRKNDFLQAEYRASRLIIPLLGFFQRGGGVPVEEIDDNILAFALIDRNGRFLYRYGDVEIDPVINEKLPLEGRVSWTAKSVVVIRPFPDRASGLPLDRGMMGMMEGSHGLEGSHGREGRFRGLPRERRREALRDEERQRESLASPWSGGSVPLVYLEYRVAGLATAVRRTRRLLALVAGVFLIFSFTILYLYRKTRRLARAFEQKQQLVQLGEAARTLAHEIKNPLGALSLQRDILRRKLPGEYRENLDAMGEELSRLNLLVQRIGDFLKNPKGNPVLLDLEEACRDALRRLAIPAEWDVDKRTGRIRFDQGRLQSVLENIIKNGWESMAGLPEAPPLALTLRRERGRIVLVIADRGEGVDPLHREKIFDPFFTTKTTGTGIGLPLSRRFVEAAGGSLILSDRPGGGTEVTITLPKADSQGSEGEGA